MADEELIDDQYKFVAGIASGSSTHVQEVSEKGTARHLAMKILRKDVPDFKVNKVKMKREAQIHQSLDHPLIVKFEKFSSNRDHTYILMEHFRSSNLKVLLKADLNKVHLKIRGLLEGICSAPSHVHQKGYIHRDIKPDNVLMNRAGEIRLCDFSLSSKEIKGFGRFFAGKMKAIEGTRTYIAPETIRRTQPTSKTDLYSLGVLFFEVLAAKTPFQAPSPEELLQKHLRAEAPNPSEFNPNVSPEMDRIVARLLKKKPVDRPASVDEVLAELKRIRIFKEDIVDAEALKKQNEDSDALEMLSEMRLDSRADAKLKHMLETNPEFARKFAEEKQAKAVKKKAATERNNARIKVAEDAQADKKAKSAPKKAAPAAAAAPQPAPMAMPMQMPMQGYPPGYPSYPQGYGAYPQGPMPMPPGMAAPMPGMPQYPSQPQMGYPQPMPQQQMPVSQPQQPPAPAVRPAAAPASPIPAQRQQPAAAPAKPVAAAPARPVPKPAPPATPASDLDFMTDLPDVL